MVDIESIMDAPTWELPIENEHKGKKTAAHPTHYDRRYDLYIIMRISSDWNLKIYLPFETGETLS
jgi:hypothetical protein